MTLSQKIRGFFSAAREEVLGGQPISQAAGTSSVDYAGVATFAGEGSSAIHTRILTHSMLLVPNWSSTTEVDARGRFYARFQTPIAVGALVWNAYLIVSLSKLFHVHTYRISGSMFRPLTLYGWKQTHSQLRIFSCFESSLKRSVLPDTATGWNRKLNKACTSTLRSLRLQGNPIP